jgi:hypothetical protein
MVQKFFFAKADRFLFGLEISAKVKLIDLVQKKFLGQIVSVLA